MTVQRDSGFAFATGIKNIAYVDWPGGKDGEQYAIRPLSRADVYTSAADAETYLADLGLDGAAVATLDEAGRPVTYRDLALRDEHLVRCMRNAANTDHQLFCSPEELRACLHSNEVDRFYVRVAAHMEKSAPLTKAEMLANKAAFDELLEMVKKKPDPESLCVLSPSLQRQFMMYLVSRLSS